MIEFRLMFPEESAWDSLLRSVDWLRRRQHIETKPAIRSDIEKTSSVSILWRYCAVFNLKDEANWSTLG